MKTLMLIVLALCMGGCATEETMCEWYSPPTSCSARCTELGYAACAGGHVCDAAGEPTGAEISCGEEDRDDVSVAYSCSCFLPKEGR